MSKIPITLRRLIKPSTNINFWFPHGDDWYRESNDTGFELFDNINPYPLIFDGSYTIGGHPIILKLNNTDYTDNTYRDKLNNKIIDHYLDYRIGFETPQLFYHHFNTLLREVMPDFNNKYRILWQYFAEKLPYGYFEHTDYKGGTQNTNEGSSTNEYGDIKNYDWSGSISGQNANDPTTTKGYNFDTPQNLSDINLNDPAHMSDANTGESHSGEMYNQNGRVVVNGQIPQIQVGDEYPTGKTTRADDTNSTENTDTFEYQNRYDEKFGYTTQDIKMISDFSNELSNIDLQIINSLRDCFLYVY